jgi:hypothetical protein
MPKIQIPPFCPVITIAKAQAQCDTHVYSALENEVDIRQCRPINLPGRQIFADLNSAN